MWRRRGCTAGRAATGSCGRCCCAGAVSIYRPSTAGRCWTTCAARWWLPCRWRCWRCVWPAWARVRALCRGTRWCWCWRRWARGRCWARWLVWHRGAMTWRWGTFIGKRWPMWCVRWAAPCLAFWCCCSKGCCWSAPSALRCGARWSAGVVCCAGRRRPVRKVPHSRAWRAWRAAMRWRWLPRWRWARCGGGWIRAGRCWRRWCAFCGLRCRCGLAGPAGLGSTRARRCCAATTANICWVWRAIRGRFLPAMSGHKASICRPITCKPRRTKSLPSALRRPISACICCLWRARAALTGLRRKNFCSAARPPSPRWRSWSATGGIFSIGMTRKPCSRCRRRMSPPWTAATCAATWWRWRALAKS